VTEEEKQMMMAMLMREQEAEAVDPGGNMIPLGASGGAPMQYSSPQQQQQGGYSGMSPMQLQGMASAAPASGAGSALTATEAASFVPAMAPESLAIGGSTANAGVGTAAAGNIGAGAGGAAGGAGGAGAGGMMAAAGPWAALAAGIYLNESQARDKGRRDENMGSYATDLLSGAVLEQDAEILGDKIGGPLGQLTEFHGEMAHPEGIVKNIGKSLMPWEWF